MEDPHVTIELDAFSGKRNPRWAVPRTAVDPILDALKDLPPADDSPRQPALGPKGLRVAFDAGPTREVHVCGPTVRVHDPSGTQHVYRDESREVLKRVVAVLRETLPSSDLQAYDGLLRYLSSQ